MIIPAGELSQKDGNNVKNIVPGDYVVVQINAANSQVLKGIPLYYTTLSEFYQESPIEFSEDFGYYTMM